MNVLFICTYNQFRSLTAEHIFRNIPGLSVRSAGISHSARHHVNSKDIEWAEQIFVMEQRHQGYLQENFSQQLGKKKIVNLNIPDEYEYMNPELIEMLKREVSVYLPLENTE